MVLAKVAQVLGVTVDEIDESTDLRGEYDVDSLELMEIGTRLENALGIRIGADALLEMRDIGHAVDLLHERAADREHA
ncbi:acyl carrier protein [Micromonospora auratinigra]|uniref:Acyl carrier protein n=1 Tax=Micromonospora auratinigra TaxID=261654 RepID=A0A1A8ZD81_9ACTN|nr:acyl carrier protein [Micromonospora auratinigra]